MKYSLSNTCTMVPGFAFKSKDFTANGFPVIKITHINPPSVTMDNLSHVDISKYNSDRLEKFLVKKGDFVFAMTGATIGKIGKVNSGSAYINQRVLTFKAKEEIIDKNYLYYALSTSSFHDYVISHVDSESAQPNISATTLGKYEIDLPDLETQKKVVRILSALDQKIGLNTKENGTLENIIKCHYKSFISNKDQKRTEYKTSDLFDYNGGYSYTSAELVDESTIGMITIKNFERTGGFKIDGFKPLAPQKTKIPTADLFDIFVACTDVTQNADIIGNAIMLLDKGEYEDTTYSMDLVKIEPRINKFALYAILSSKDFKNFALGYKSGTTVLHLSKKCLKEYVISLPEEKEVEAFGEIVERLCKKISNNLAENRNLCQIRNVLLPKLLSGEIDVNRIEV